MNFEELVERYLEEGYTEEEAQEKARQELEELEHLDWFRFQDLINKRP